MIATYTLLIQHISCFINKTELVIVNIGHCQQYIKNSQFIPNKTRCIAIGNQSKLHLENKPTNLKIIAIIAIWTLNHRLEIIQMSDSVSVPLKFVSHVFYSHASYCWRYHCRPPSSQQVFFWNTKMDIWGESYRRSIVLDQIKKKWECKLLF